MNEEKASGDIEMRDRPAAGGDHDTRLTVSDAVEVAAIYANDSTVRSEDNKAARRKSTKPEGAGCSF